MAATTKMRNSLLIDKKKSKERNKEIKKTHYALHGTNTSRKHFLSHSLLDSLIHWINTSALIYIYSFFLFFFFVDEKTPYYKQTRIIAVDLYDDNKTFFLFILLFYYFNGKCGIRFIDHQIEIRLSALSWYMWGYIYNVIFLESVAQYI